MTTFYGFYGYDVEVHLGSQILTTALQPKEFGLCDQLTITGQENVARSAIFSIIPPEDMYDLQSYQNKPVKVFLKSGNDPKYYQVFTGFVNIPSINLKTRKLTFNCTDKRKNQILQLPYSYIQQIGFYDNNVFGVPKDQYDELTKRLNTVTASFDFDNYGRAALTSWTPKILADFTFNSIDIKQNSVPTISYTDRSETLNTVNITVTYTFQRLHQQCCNINWPGYSSFVNDWWSQGKPSFPTKDQVRSAVTASNWMLINPDNEDNFVDLWPAGGYSYNGSSIIWQPNQVINQYKQRTVLLGYEKDSLGNFVTVKGDKVPIYGPVIDTDGNPVMDLISSDIIDTASKLCRGCNFNCALLFAQNVKEIYNLNVISQQSIDIYNTINTVNTITINDPYDVAQWENSKTAKNINENFYVDIIPNYNQINSALITSYYQAKHDIINAHRDTTITFQTKLLQPQIDLKHTLELNISDPKSNTSHISTKAKIKSFTHQIDFYNETAFTEITLILNKIGTSDTTDAFHFNTPTQDPNYIGEPQTIVLGTHLGIDPNPANTPGADKWNGWIANKEQPNTLHTGIQRTQYPENFIVDFPPISDNIRNTISYTANTTLNVAIVDDDLETST